MRLSPLIPEAVYPAVVLSLLLTATVTCGPGDNLDIPEEADPAAITVLRGDDQRGVVGQLLADSFVVLVSDLAGRPVPGKRVVFRLTPGETGGLDPLEATTGADGRAATRGLLGTVIGAWEARAEVATRSGRPLEALFHAVGEPAEADSMFATQGQDEGGLAGELLAESLTVRVVDRFRNPVPDVAVTWEVTGGGSVSPAESATGPDGSASVARRLGSVAGAQTAVASAGRLQGSPVTFRQLALAGQAATLVVVSGSGQSGQPGKELPDPLAVKVADAAHNPIEGLSIAWLVAAGNGSVKPSSSKTDAEGVAVSVWTLDDEPGPATLTASAPGLSPVQFKATGVAAQEGRGQWSAPFDWPVVGVHLTLLPNGQVLTFGKKGTPRVWNPATGAFSAVPSSTLLFCGGHAFLADGRLLVTGGHIAHDHGLPDANLFDPVSRTWTQVASMAQGRWYPTNTALANGEMVTVGGADEDADMVTIPEVWDGAGWRRLTGASLDLPYYPWLFLAPNGKVFYAGFNRASRYLDPNGSGAWSFVANSHYGDRIDGAAVMYEPGKVMIVGGGGGTAATAGTRTAEIIDLNNAAPTWSNTGSMNFARRHLNATVLPTGEVLVIGGTSGPGFNSAEGTVHQAELWNPETGTWKVLAANTINRIYHSTAVVLRDGRVLAAGAGERTGDVDQFNAELFSPPYLFRGGRPTLTSAPVTLSYGSSFAVATPDAQSVDKVTLLRPGSTTHGFDQNQRFISLHFSAGSGELAVTAPANGNLAPPGDYLLFLVSDDGVPSVGRTVRLR